MKQHHVALVVTILVLIVGGMFMFAYLAKHELTKKQVPSGETGGPTIEIRYPEITSVDGKHFFDGRVHTIVGEIVFPSTCDLLNWSTRVLEPVPQTAIIDFTVVNHTESCAQTPTAQRFMVQFEAEKDATIRARFIGRDIQLNLTPGGEGEKPEDYINYSKG